MIAYGSSMRPHLARKDNRFVFVLPREHNTNFEFPLDPEDVRNLVVGGVHALEDQATLDKDKGYHSTAMLANRWVQENLVS